MTGSRRGAAAVVAAAAMLALTGCGGHTVTKRDVIARGNAICVAALRQIRALPTPTAAGSLAGLSGYLQRVAPIVAREAAQLRALPRPAAGRDLLNRYIAAAAAGASQYRALAAAAAAGDAAGAAQALARLRQSPAAALATGYGLTQCAAPGSTVPGG